MDRARKLLNRVLFEKDRGRNVATADFLHLGRHQHRFQRVAAELEKIVGDTDRPYVENFLPNSRELDLQRLARRLERPVQNALLLLWRGQRVAIDLAVDRQWEHIERNER